MMLSLLSHPKKKIMSEKNNHTCCNKQEVKKGLWSAEEDQRLVNYIKANNGFKNWSALPTLAGLQRCGKSCRLRWLNYLKPDLKRGNFTEEEAELIIQLHNILGNKWAKIANHLPGRTDNEVKNYWNSTLKRRLSKKKRQNSFNITTTPSVVAPPVTIPTSTTTTTMEVSATTLGRGSIISGGNGGGTSCNNGVSYSAAPAPPPPPPPPADHQEYNPNTIQEFGSFSNSAANYDHMNFNANVINPEDLIVPTPSMVPNPPPSMVPNPPPVQPDWTSNNNSHPLNFDQIFQGESFAPFFLPDITASSSAYNDILGWDFPVYSYMNNDHDPFLMMMANPQEENIVTNNNNVININNNTTTTNNNNPTTILTSGDGMDFLETILSPFPPEPSPASSPSSFLNEQAFINDQTLLPFNQFLENPNDNIFGSRHAGFD